jgi:hypothetical protein
MVRPRTVEFAFILAAASLARMPAVYADPPSVAYPVPPGIGYFAPAVPLGPRYSRWYSSGPIAHHHYAPEPPGDFFGYRARGYVSPFISPHARLYPHDPRLPVRNDFYREPIRQRHPGRNFDRDFIRGHISAVPRRAKR